MAPNPKKTEAPATLDLRPDAVLPLAEAAAEAHVSPRYLRMALARGEVGGRRLGGPGGWLTTRQAILRWARGEAPGPQAVDVRAVPDAAEEEDTDTSAQPDE